MGMLTNLKLSKPQSLNPTNSTIFLAPKHNILTYISYYSNQNILNYKVLTNLHMYNLFVEMGNKIITFKI